jgi:hypothetical protein
VRGDKIVLLNMPIQNPIGSGFRSITRRSYALTHLRYYLNHLKEYLKIAERFFKRRFKGGREKQNSEHSRLEISEPEVGPHAIAVFDHYLGKMRDSCKAEGIDFIVIYVPVGDNISKEQPEYNYIGIVRGVCQKRGIPLLDLTTVFKPLINGANGEPLYFRDDLHWTAQGHRLAAETIYKYIHARTTCRN